MDLAQEPQQTTVIVGAGVAGLTAACSLLLDGSYNGRVVLIDNSATDNNSQKASSGINFPSLPNANNIKDAEDDREAFIARFKSVTNWMGDYSTLFLDESRTLLQQAHDNRNYEDK